MGNADENFRTMRIRCEGDRVLMIHDGRLLATMPWQTAHEMAKALNDKAHEARRYQLLLRGAQDPADVRGVLSKIGRPRVIQKPPPVPSGG